MQLSTIPWRTSVSLIVAALLLTSAPVVGTAQSSTPRASAVGVSHPLDNRSRAELLAAREQVWRAWFAYDSVQLERLLPRDNFIGAARTLSGAPASRPSRATEPRGAAGGSCRSSSRAEMQVFGDVVVIYTAFRYTTERAGQQNRAAGNAVEVFVRRNGRWQNPSWYLDFIPQQS